MWRPLNKTTKTIVKTYQEAKELFDKTIVEHTATLVYAIKNNSHANLNHLDDFSRKTNMSNQRPVNFNQDQKWV